MHIGLEEDLLSFNNINYVNPLVNLVGFMKQFLICAVVLGGMLKLKFKYLMFFSYHFHFT